MLASLVVWISVSPLRAEEVVAGVKPGVAELPQAQAAAVPAAWWSDHSAGWIGGIGGSTIGFLSGLIGMLAGLGKARHLTLALAWGMVILGFVSLFAGAVAVICRQPYGVYFPLLLIGVVPTAVWGGNLPHMKRRYAELELRRMAAMDLGNR